MTERKQVRTEYSMVRNRNKKNSEYKNDRTEKCQNEKKQTLITFETNKKTFF